MITNFGTHEKQTCHKITFESPSKSFKCSVITFGGIVQSFIDQRQNGNNEHLQLGYDSLDSYTSYNGHLGATCGRFANRISKARISKKMLELSEKKEAKEEEEKEKEEEQFYHLPVNNINACLHGGNSGYSLKVWDSFDVIYEKTKTTTSSSSSCEEKEKPQAVGVALHLCSPDGDNGFPGELNIAVKYFFDEQESFVMDFLAVASPKNKTATVVNLTNHCYWNLDGYASASSSEVEESSSSSSATTKTTKITKSAMETHRLEIPKGKYFLKVEKESIPTGEVLSVKGTGLDFTAPGGKLLCEGGLDTDCCKVLNPFSKEEIEQQGKRNGYDHCIVLDRSSCCSGQMQHAATLSSTQNSKRTMKVFTTFPSVQVYSSNFLEKEESSFRKGHSGSLFGYRCGVCLECQYFLDSPNNSHFPSTVLKPGEIWHNQTKHVFS